MKRPAGSWERSEVGLQIGWSPHDGKSALGEKERKELSLSVSVSLSLSLMEGYNKSQLSASQKVGSHLTLDPIAP